MKTFIFGFLVGGTNVFVGFNYTDWQYWVILSCALAGYVLGRSDEKECWEEYED